MNVSGKGAFVTGGARGLGRGIVEILLSRGAKVFFCDISENNGRATEQELQKVYGASHVTFSQCDVTNAAQFKDVFELAVSKLGAVEICVNNAGIMDERVWETMLDINTRATIRGCQLAFDHMDKSRGGKGGVIVNMVSIAGLFSEHFFPVYVATKHAVLGFTLSWAACMEDGKQGVSWACLCPDGCDTDLRRNLQEGQINDIPGYSNPNKLLLSPGEVADAFLMLVENKDSNGAILQVSKTRGSVYRKRMIVDADGASNPFLCD